MTALEPWLALLAGALLLGAALTWLVRAHRPIARRGSRLAPFPATWRELLQRELPLYRQLPAELAAQLETKMAEFIARVEFVGCSGLTVTDEMRALIAAQACMLVLNRDGPAYADLYSVLIYPDEFLIDGEFEDEHGLVTTDPRPAQGEAQDLSRVILSWRHVKSGAADADPYNVVIHEFAHHLDHGLGGALTDRAAAPTAAREWHDVLEAEHERLCAAVDRGESTLIDPYGAEDLAEFFATASEAFFEAPNRLAAGHASLYRGLAGFYGLDPARWPAATVTPALPARAPA